MTPLETRSATFKVWRGDTATGRLREYSTGVSEAIARSAIERKESRGGHFRDDFPDKNPDYATFNIVTAQRADGSMEVRRVPLPPMPAELKQIIEEQKA